MPYSHTISLYLRFLVFGELCLHMETAHKASSMNANYNSNVNKLYVVPALTLLYSSICYCHIAIYLPSQSSLFPNWQRKEGDKFQLIKHFPHLGFIICKCRVGTK